MKKILCSVGMIVLLAMLAGCGQTEKNATGEESKQVVSVEVADAMKGDLTMNRSVYGRTLPDQTTPILLQAPGEVESLAAENGDQVEENDVIATILTPAGKQTLRAPSTGEIARLTAVKGELVSNEEPFAVVAKLTPLKIEFAVTAGIRDLLRLDDSLATMINGVEHEAILIQLDKLPNETGLYPVAASIENSGGAILPGVVAELTVPERQIAGALIVPTASLVEENEETFVYVVKDDIVVKQAVTVMATQSEQTAVEGGIQDGDQLVVTGQLTLSDDAHVKVVKGE